MRKFLDTIERVVETINNAILKFAYEEERAEMRAVKFITKIRYNTLTETEKEYIVELYTQEQKQKEIA